MPRKLSAIAPDWWDYTTLDADLIDEAARLTADDLARLSRPGFSVVLYDTLEDFYLAEALEYVDAWRQSTDDNPRRHLRADRAHRAPAARGPHRQRAWVRRPLGTFLGHGRMVRCRDRQGSAGDASAQLRARGSRAVFRPHRPLPQDARRAPAFSES